MPPHTGIAQPPAPTKSGRPLAARLAAFRFRGHPRPDRFAGAAIGRPTPSLNPKGQRWHARPPSPSNSPTKPTNPLVIRRLREARGSHDRFAVARAIGRSAPSRHEQTATPRPNRSADSRHIASERYAKTKNPAQVSLSGVSKRIRRRPTLPQRSLCSTIGPGGLNFRVRDGIGWGPSGIATGKRCSTGSWKTQLPADESGCHVAAQTQRRISR